MSVVKTYEKEEHFRDREVRIRQIVEKYGLHFDYRGYDDYTGWFVHTKRSGLLNFGDKNVICIGNFYLRPDSVVEILKRGYEDVAKEVQSFLKGETN